MTARALLLATCAVWIGATAVQAQTRTVVGVGSELQRFSFSDGESVGTESLTQLSVPLAVSVDINEMFNVQLLTAWARGQKERPDGESLTLAGPTDTQLSATVRVGGGAASFTGIVALPTGATEHDQNELEVAGNIASDLLPFRVSSWGSGGGVGGRAALARRFGTVGAGVSVGYFVAQEFTPVSFSDTDFRPGSNLVVRGALDASVGQAGKLSLQLTARSYGNDIRDDEDFIKSGTRIEAIGSYAFAASRRSSAIVYGAILQRAEGEDVNGQPVISGRSLILAGGGGRLRVGQHLFLPTLDLRVLRSDDAVDQGYETGIGARAEIQAGSATLVPLVRVHIGKLQIFEGTAESSYIGTDFGLTVRFGTGTS